MADPAPKPEQAASRKAACIHCGYDLRDTPVDGKCPECGNPATDTREGTLFYRLPPTRLGVITAGAALTCVMHVDCLLFALLDTGRWLVPGGLPDAAVAVWSAMSVAGEMLYVPWIALFVLAAPLNRHAPWVSLMRIAVIALAVALVLFRTGIEFHERANPPTGPGLSAAQVLGNIVLNVFGYIPVLLTCVQLHKISQRLPSAPFASLGSLAVVCSLVLVVRAGVEGSGVLSQSALPQAGIAGLTVLLWAAPTVFPFLIYRELRAIARDVDADHPYSRV